MESPANTQRKLAAIMFTDIVDYSAMADKNEKNALELLKTHNDLLREEFSKFNGDEVKNTGDGFLVKFSNTLDSLKSAISIQKSLDLYNTTKDKNEQINIRIGLHLGDVEQSEDDIHGDGVNIAARIEPFADSGGICLSRQIYDQVSNKIQFNINSLGEKKLKNITKPMEIYNISLPWKRSDLRSVGDIKVANSIAVLPFENMSSDKENEYFCDGLTEELLNVLAKEKDLKVISRTSSFSYKDKRPSMRQVADELGVENILEGSVRKAGDRLRITAQLIQAADGFHLWSDTYDRTPDDIFDLQDEIASTILTELLDRITTVDSSGDTGKSKNREAYNLYLEGIKLWNERETKPIEKAIKLFNKAIEIDSNFSLAYCMMADSYELLSNYSAMYGRKGHISKAKDCIKKAEDLNDTSAEFYTAKASVLYWTQSDEKIDYLNTAIEINPNYATAYHRLAITYQTRQDLESAIREIDRAISLDPNSAIIQFAASNIHIANKDYQNALKILIRLRETHLTYWPETVSLSMADCYSYMLEWEKANKLVKTFAEGKVDKLDHHISHFVDFYIKTNQISKIDKLYIDFKLVKDDKDWHNLFVDGIISRTLGNNDYATTQFKESYKVCENELPAPGIHLCIHYIDLTKYNEASKILSETMEKLNHKMISDRWMRHLKMFAKMLHGIISIKNNDLENAYVTMSEIRKIEDVDDSNIFCLSGLYFILDNADEGYSLLNQYIESQGISALTRQDDMINDPLWENLRKDPRYIDLLKKLKLYDYWKDDPEIKKLEKGK